MRTREIALVMATVLTGIMTHTHAGDLASGTQVSLVSTRGCPAVYDLGNRRSDRDGVAETLVATVKGGEVQYELDGDSHLLRLGTTSRPDYLTRPIRLRNDGEPKTVLVAEADTALMNSGRSMFAPCFILALLSAVATPIPYLLKEQNDETELTGTVLAIGAGVFTAGASVGVVVKRRGRARIELASDRKARRYRRDVRVAVR